MHKIIVCRKVGFFTKYSVKKRFNRMIMRTLRNNNDEKIIICTHVHYNIYIYIYIYLYDKNSAYYPSMSNSGASSTSGIFLSEHPKLLECLF
jgi:hypothetical protein